MISQSIRVAAMELPRAFHLGDLGVAPANVPPITLRRKGLAAV
jgi:hypothetical protein